MPSRAAGLAVASFCALAWHAAASDAVPSASLGVSEGPVAPKLLVLRDGKVVEGTIRLGQGGYEVEVEGGRLFLGESFVWFGSENRRQAFDDLRRRAPCRTADEHVALARWCVTNRLYACAREELAIALDQEPEHASARATLRTLEGILRAGSAADPGVVRPSASEESAEAIGGVPSAVAREFVAHVQPLLLNRCGNAACHGSTASNGFTLLPLRSGGAYRRLSEDNLRAVRSQLSPDDPAASPLLTEGVRVGHGGVRKPLFAGPAGAAQVRTLTAWVAQAARSTPAAAPGTESPAPAKAPSPLRLASATDDDLIGIGPAAGPVPAEPHVEPAADAAGELLRKTLAGDRPDAFDPEEFNRRYGPDAGRPSEATSRGATR